MSGAKPLLPLYAFKAWKGKNNSFYIIKLLFSVTKTECVYCAVRTAS